MVLLLHYTMDQKLCNLTYASIFFGVTAPSLASPFRTNILMALGIPPSMFCHTGSQIHSFSHLVPRPCVQFGSYLNTVIASKADVYRRLRKFLERREIFARFLFHVSNQVSFFSLFLTIILLQNFYDTPPDECVFGKCYFPFLVNRLRSFGRVSLSMVLVLVFPQGCDLLFFSFSFLDSARGGPVEVRRWTRNPLVPLRSTPEDSQPFMSLMVSQSVSLYLRSIWICLVEPMFHIPLIPLVFSIYIFLKRRF